MQHTGGMTTEPHMAADAEPARREKQPVTRGDLVTFTFR
jgi:hypothetical protein